MSEETEAALKEINTGSTLDGLFRMGFTILGDSRDFTNGSIQVTLGRGQERLSWTLPMKVAKVGVDTPEGASYLQIPIDHISFDVVYPIK